MGGVSKSAIRLARRRLRAKLPVVVQRWDLSHIAGGTIRRRFVVDGALRGVSLLAVKLPEEPLQ